MKYIEPKFQSTCFTCPHCKTLAVYLWQYDGPDDEDMVSTAQCAACDEKSIWYKKTMVFPTSSAPEPNADMPESVLKLYDEAGEIYSKSPRAACALLRLAIDRLCNELGETDRDINKNISALVKKDLPVKIQKALDIVRVVGNKAVHPGQIALDVDDINTAKALFDLTNMIVENMISEPQKIDSLFTHLPQSAKDAIEKRDKQ